MPHGLRMYQQTFDQLQFAIKSISFSDVIRKKLRV